MVSPVSAAYANTTQTQKPPYGQPAPALVTPGITLLPNPDWTYNWGIWRMIRDCYEGEMRIKAQGQIYLRKLSAHKDNEYEGFLNRSYFYNATRRTHDGLMGSLFRKPPEVTLPPAAQSLDLDDVTIDSEDVYSFIKKMDSELLMTGRYGILVDLPSSPVGEKAEKPYLSGYAAEAVYSWREVLHEGRRIVDRVVLVEDECSLTEYGTTRRQIIRVLRLDPVGGGELVSDVYDPSQLVYSQEVIRPQHDERQPWTIERIPVTVRGRSLDYIPFVFVNVKNLLPAVGCAPLLDIATLNISHYQSTALLEHGRFYAGMPTYVVSAGTEAPGGDELSGTTLAVGPSNVWELETGAKAWILEFNGHGLSFLENAVDSKQLQMQSLGGKLISSQRKAAALSTEAYTLMEQGDEATLLDVAEQTGAGMARALTIVADFMAIELPKDQKILVEMNKEFVHSDLTARELRAVQSLYERGLIPLDVLYYALREVNVIPIEYSLEDFKRLLGNPPQVYTDPEAEAERRARIRIAEIAHDPTPADLPDDPETGARSSAAPQTANNPSSGSFPPGATPPRPAPPPPGAPTSSDATARPGGRRNTLRPRFTRGRSG